MTGNHVWPEEGVSRIPYWIYSDPEIYAREQKMVFENAPWNYVGLEAEIPEPGDYKLSYIGEKPVIVSRGGDGAVHVFVNRCSHRGVRLCRADHGHVKEFLCPYHNWSYDLSGKLVGVPFLRGLKKQGGYPEDFDPEAHHIPSLKVSVHNGVIFASFLDAPEPFEQFLGPDMLRYFDRVFDGRKLKIMGYQRQAMRANWKLMVDNIKDPYHATILHVFLVTFGLFRSDQRGETWLGGDGGHSVLLSSRAHYNPEQEAASLANFRQDLKLEDPDLLQPAREFPGEATVVIQCLWPGLIVQQQSNTLATRHIIPKGPQLFELHWTYFGYEDDDEAMTQRRVRQANLMGPSGYVSLDDSEMMEFSQLGVAPFADGEGILEMGGRDHGNLDHTVTEACIRGFYARYRQAMGL